eukprot:TRINITY_DN10242_c0_g1_i1.p1 TRINITY_DN10242_c0_g1~~TRINITY_DN10242_c0_g1_i1.p1  ORF type:complete len:1547 (+),score=286.54 TRINITY_DN10242_c0_g1_i1:303-4643(+)
MDADVRAKAADVVATSSGSLLHRHGSVPRRLTSPLPIARGPGLREPDYVPSEEATRDLPDVQEGLVKRGGNTGMRGESRRTAQGVGGAFLALPGPSPQPDAWTGVSTPFGLVAAGASEVGQPVGRLPGKAEQADSLWNEQEAARRVTVAREAESSLRKEVEAKEGEAQRLMHLQLERQREQQRVEERRKEAERARAEARRRDEDERRAREAAPAAAEAEARRQKAQEEEEARRRREAEVRRKAEKARREEKEAKAGRMRTLIRRWRRRAEEATQRRERAEAALAACGTAGPRTHGAEEVVTALFGHLHLSPESRAAAAATTSRVLVDGLPIRRLDHAMEEQWAERDAQYEAQRRPIDLAGTIGPPLRAKNPRTPVLTWKLAACTRRLDTDTDSVMMDEDHQEDGGAGAASQRLSKWLAGKLSAQREGAAEPGVIRMGLRGMGSAHEGEEMSGSGEAVLANHLTRGPARGAGEKEKSPASGLNVGRSGVEGRGAISGQGALDLQGAGRGVGGGGGGGESVRAKHGGTSQVRWTGDRGGEDSWGRQCVWYMVKEVGFHRTSVQFPNAVTGATALLFLVPRLVSSPAVLREDAQRLRAVLACLPKGAHLPLLVVAPSTHLPSSERSSRAARRESVVSVHSVSRMEQNPAYGSSNPSARSIGSWRGEASGHASARFQRAQPSSQPTPARSWGGSHKTSGLHVTAEGLVEEPVTHGAFSSEEVEAERIIREGLDLATLALRGLIGISRVIFIPPASAKSSPSASLPVDEVGAFTRLSAASGDAIVVRSSISRESPRRSVSPSSDRAAASLFLDDASLRDGLEWLAQNAPPQPPLQAVLAHTLISSHIRVLQESREQRVGVAADSHWQVAQSQVVIEQFNRSVEAAHGEVLAAVTAYPPNCPPPEATPPDSWRGEGVTLALPPHGWNSDSVITANLLALSSLRLPLLPASYPRTAAVSALSWLTHRLQFPPLGLSSGRQELWLADRELRVAIEEAFALLSVYVAHVSEATRPGSSPLLSHKEVLRAVEGGCRVEWEKGQPQVQMHWPLLLEPLIQRHLARLLGQEPILLYVLQQAEPVVAFKEEGPERSTPPPLSSPLKALQLHPPFLSPQTGHPSGTVALSDPPGQSAASSPAAVRAAQITEGVLIAHDSQVRGGVHQVKPPPGGNKQTPWEVTQARLRETLQRSRELDALESSGRESSRRTGNARRQSDPGGAAVVLVAGGTEKAGESSPFKRKELQGEPVESSPFKRKELQGEPVDIPATPSELAMVEMLREIKSMAAGSLGSSDGRTRGRGLPAEKRRKSAEGLMQAAMARALAVDKDGRPLRTIAPDHRGRTGRYLGGDEAHLVDEGTNLFQGRGRVGGMGDEGVRRALVTQSLQFRPHLPHPVNHVHSFSSPPRKQQRSEPRLLFSGQKGLFSSPCHLSPGGAPLSPSAARTSPGGAGGDPFVRQG